MTETPPTEDLRKLGRALEAEVRQENKRNEAELEEWMIEHVKWTWYNPWAPDRWKLTDYRKPATLNTLFWKTMFRRMLGLRSNWP